MTNDLDPEAEATQRLEEAVAHYVAVQGDGHMVTGWCLVAAGLNADNIDNQSSQYFYEYDGSLAYHSALGLAHMLVGDVKRWGVSGEEDDDD